MSRHLEVLAAEIVVLAQGLDDLISSLAPVPRHRADVPVDSVSRVDVSWPPVGPRHVVGDNDVLGGDAA